MADKPHYVAVLKDRISQLEAEKAFRHRAVLGIIQSRFDKDAGEPRTAYRQALEEVERLYRASLQTEADAGRFDKACTHCNSPLPVDDGEYVEGFGTHVFCDHDCKADWRSSVWAGAPRKPQGVL